MAGDPHLPSAASGFALRDAIERDLDDITRVHVEGFTEEPQNWTKREYAEYLQQPSKYVVHVLEASVPDKDLGLNVTKPVGVAVWNIAVLMEAIGDPGLDQRRDIDRGRLEAFLNKAGQRFKTYFAKWGENQVNLSTPAVHPDFRRRRGGAMLINWGIKRAEQKAWPVTL